MLYFIKHDKLEMNNMVFSANSFPGFTCHFDSKNESVTEEVDRKFNNSEKVKHFSFLKFPRLYALENHGVDENDEERRRIKEFLSKEDKWDRVKRMYSSNEFGELSPELRYVLNGGIMCTLMGGFIGALESMKKRRDNFFKVNAATKYESEHLARRDLYDRMTLSGAKGFLRQGLKYGSFSTLYMLGTITAANFNNKVTFWEHMACAAFLGSLSKINFGIKGMIAAGLIGGILGLLSGGVVKTAMWMSGITVEEMRYWQHGYYAKELSNKNTQPTKE